jgi:hypothetical protein
MLKAANNSNRVTGLSLVGQIVLSLCLIPAYGALGAIAVNLLVEIGSWSCSGCLRRGACSVLKPVTPLQRLSGGLHHGGFLDHGVALRGQLGRAP